MNNELWCPIKETEGCYEISNLGRVKSIQRKGTINNDKIIKPLLKKDNYYQVNLKFHGKSIWRRINRLVAQAFIPNPNNLPCVNHKDGNKLNNNVDNLEWCTYRDNTNHYINNFYKHNKGRGKISPKCVIRIDKKGNKTEFSSLARASKSTFNDINKRYGISKACRHNKSYLGYYWKFIDDNRTEDYHE